MRKATAITTVLLLSLFGVMLFVADRALQPLARDGRLTLDLTRALEHRGEIESGTKARVQRIRAGAAILATQGQGVRVHLVPSEAVRQRPRAMGRLAQLSAEEVLQAYQGRAPDWVEVTLQLEAGEEPREVTILLRETAEGLRVEGPSVPATWPPRPVPLRRTAPAPPLRAGAAAGEARASEGG